MTIKRIMTAVAASGAALVIAASPTFAAQTAETHKHPATTAKSTPHAAMDAKCQTMMAEKQTMMADMKAADQRIDGLVATMNAASGMAKADATTAVVSEMVTQQRTMRDSKMKMDQDMMAHMMEHMQAGKDSMAACPMMKQMGGMKH